MNAQEMMKMDKADLVWRILTLESKVEAQAILIGTLEDKDKPPFDPEEVVVGSVWEYKECEDSSRFLKGEHYRVERFCDNGSVMINSLPLFKFVLLRDFKRIS